MSGLLQDLRDGWRSLRQAPGLTLAAILSLGLGIGANTTVFSWVQAVLLRPIPGATDPEGLLILGLQSREGRERSWSYPNYRDARAAATTFELIAQDDVTMSVMVDGRAERAFGGIVSGNYFSALGITAALGRVLTPEDDVNPGAHPVIVLSHGYWQRRFNGDPSIVGRELMANNVPLTVIGVAQPGFIGSFLGLGTAGWMPMAMQPQMMGGDRLEQRGNGWFSIYARLRPGISRAQAQAEAETVIARLANQHPDLNSGLRIDLLRPWESRFGAPSVLAPILAVLSVVAMLVLALACANVTNLLLSRAVGRRRDMAIRLSLGASRTRLLRQLLTESLLLAALAGGAGLTIAYWTSGTLMAFVPPVDLPIDLGLRIDRLTFAFAFLVSLVTGVVFGLAPALQASNPDTAHALKEEAGRSMSGGATARRLRSALVVAQVAVCLVLLVSAVLFARSLTAARLLDPGFDTTHQLVATVDLGANGYTQEAGWQFQTHLLERVGALPGVQSASLARLVPLGMSGMNSRIVSIDGYSPSPNEELNFNYNNIGPRYFETMRAPLVAGREFEIADVRGTEPVVMVNETMARRYWPDGNALGGRVRFANTWHRVVGIAPNVKQRTLNESPAPYLYLAMAQYYASNATILVRTLGDAGGSIAAVREAVRALDPNLPVFDARTMVEHAQTAVFPQRMGATLLGVMGIVALLLATIGLYGVISYAVGQRRAEMGIRLALGATPARLQRMVVTQGLVMAGAGVVVGLGAALGAAPLLRSMLPGITPSDPLTFIVVPLGLTLVALAAAWIPARRAAGTDPVIALRAE